VGASQKETDSATIDLYFWEDVRVFVEEPQRWVEGSIEMLKEKRFGVDGVYRDMLSAFDVN